MAFPVLPCWQGTLVPTASTHGCTKTGRCEATWPRTTMPLLRGQCVHHILDPVGGRRGTRQVSHQDFRIPRPTAAFERRQTKHTQAPLGTVSPAQAGPPLTLSSQQLATSFFTRSWSKCVPDSCPEAGVWREAELAMRQTRSAFAQLSCSSGGNSKVTEEPEKKQPAKVLTWRIQSWGWRVSADPALL